MNVAFDTGRWAYMCLAELSDNPYNPNNQPLEFGAWEEGWLEQAEIAYWKD